jgi:hypothetical protein
MKTQSELLQAVRNLKSRAINKRASTEFLTKVGDLETVLQNPDAITSENEAALADLEHELAHPELAAGKSPNPSMASKESAPAKKEEPKEPSKKG